MHTKSFILAFLLQAVTKSYVNAATKPEIDKTPWKPVMHKSNRTNARQYHPSSSNSQAYSAPQQQMMARPVTYVPPQVTFNPPQVLYGNPSVTKAVSSPSQYRQIQQNYAPSPQQSYGPSPQQNYSPSPQQSYMPSPQQSYMPSPQQSYMPSPQQSYMPSPQQSYMPSPQQNYAHSSQQNYVQASASPVPSYAAPVQSYQYVMSQPTPSTTPPPVLQSITYHLVPQQATSNSQSSQPSASTTFSQSALPPPNFTISQPSPSSAAAKSYGPAQGYHYQLVQQPPAEPTPPAPTIIFTPTTPAPYKLPSELPPPISSPAGSNSDNASFVDVVTTLSRYFRATGTQLGEMFTQLNNNTEMNTWGFNSWTTPTTTTTTPAPTTAHPAHQPSVVVMPIMMPAPAAAPAPQAPPIYPQPQPIYHSPPPPPPPTYSQPLPPPMYAQPPPQLQPSYSQPQPLYSQPPPTYSQPPPTYSQPPPTYSQPPPTYSQPPPAYPQPPPTHSHPPVLPHPHPPLSNTEGKTNNNFEVSNSIEHDYYYDCDK